MGEESNNLPNTLVKGKVKSEGVYGPSTHVGANLKALPFLLSDDHDNNNMNVLMLIGHISSVILSKSVFYRIFMIPFKRTHYI